MCNSERKPHVHAELIKAWADGAIIQYLHGGNSVWEDVRGNLPNWLPDMKYRIKPEQSDFEKYGIEKGDVWKITRQASYSFTVGVLSRYNFKDTEGITREPDERMVLLFRRGVVDKL